MGVLGTIFGDRRIAKKKARGDVQGLIKELSHKDSFVQLHATWALGEVGEPAVEPLLAVLRARTPHGYPRPEAHDAADALGLIGKPAVEPLIAALHEGEPYAVEEVIRALGATHDARAVEALVAGLPGWRPGLRYKAIEALGKIGDLGALEPLLAWLGNPKCKGDERSLCTAALGELQKANPESWGPAETARVERASAGAAPPAAEPALRRYTGGLGEPYCSQECYSRGAEYALMDLDGAVCGVCGTPVRSLPGQRGYAVIPFDGKALVVCAACVPAMQIRLRSHNRCCVCQRPVQPAGSAQP